jgi:flagellar biosynthesis/type III secretory pathway M-ring protein FliF/YscJ
MNKTVRYILIASAFLILFVSLIIVSKNRQESGLESKSNQNIVINNQEEDPNDDNNQTGETEETTVNEIVDNTLNEIDKQLEGLDASTDFEDFGIIE